jgi:hypothetical protein
LNWSEPCPKDIETCFKAGHEVGSVERRHIGVRGFEEKCNPFQCGGKKEAN